MVNVGGRSKGCSSCRRRRVKCDENRPVCKRCQRSGLDCDGPKEIAFVQGTIVKSRRSQKSAAAWMRYDPEEQDFAVRPLPPSAIALRHNEREVYICHARKYLYPNGPIDLGLQDLQLSDITTADRGSRASGSVFPDAVVSFATVYFGAQHRQASILAQGYAMHGAALKQLNHALSDSRCYIRDDVILSVIALAMLECLVPTGPKNYLKHMLGLERLLELRKPEPLARCPTKRSDLYKGVRYMILLASLRTKTPSILARPEWKAILRVNCSDQELQEQDLCDVLADCTVLLAKRDRVISCWEADFENANEQLNTLTQKALALLTYLRAWKERWDSDEHNASTEAKLYPDDGLSSPASSVDDDPQHMPTVIRFKSSSAGKMLMLYNNTLIYVLQTLASLSFENPEDSNIEDFSPTTLQYTARGADSIWRCISNAEWAVAERLAALQIARCIPDYLHHKRARSDPGFSSSVVQWAVTTAWTTLGGNETADGRWVMCLLNGRSSQAIAEGLWDT